jgi:hypothetical protein
VNRRDRIHRFEVGGLEGERGRTLRPVALGVQQPHAHATPGGVKAADDDAALPVELATSDERVDAHRGAVGEAGGVCGGERHARGFERLLEPRVGREEARGRSVGPNERLEEAVLRFARVELAASSANGWQPEGAWRQMSSGVEPRKTSQRA